MGVNNLAFVQPGQADTLNDYSDSIWGMCPLNSLREGSVPGVLLEYDFTGFKRSTNVNAAEAFWSQEFMVFGSDGFAIADADIVGGGVSIGSDGDDEGGSIRQALTPFQISRSTQSFWFEARIAKSTIADTKHNVFLGMIDATATTAISPITAAGALADVNLVGFQGTEAVGKGAYMSTVYKADGVTAVTVQADAVTLAAATYTKLGMYYRPAVNPFNLGTTSSSPASTANDGYGKYLLSFYQDGRLLATQKQIPSADGTDFPNDVRLSFCFSVLNATASSPGTSQIDRVRVAQVYYPMNL